MIYLLLGCVSDTSAASGHPLHVFHVATQDLPEHHAMSDGASDGTRTGVISAFLFEHPDGRVLIDTAFGRVTANEGTHVYPGRAFSAGTANFEMGTPVIDQLPAMPDRIVATHLHADHAGGLADFPDTPLLVDPREWEAALSEPVFHGYVPDAYAERTAVEDLVFDGEPVGPFQDTHDVFGDGSLVLISAPGHTAGSTLVLVNQHILLVGDTAWIDENWQEPMAKGRAIRNNVEFDWKLELQQQWAIKQWAEASPDRVVVSGHEPDNVKLPALLQ